jgi:hypothetical protein
MICSSVFVLILSNIPFNSVASTTHVSVAVDIAGAKIKVIDNPKAKWTNLSAKGTFGGILVAAEHHK